MSTRILIIAHAPLANALRDCALHVFPECSAEVMAMDVPPHEAPEDTLTAARLLLAAEPQSDILVLTDVMGATPRQHCSASCQRVELPFNCRCESAHVAANGVLSA